MVSITQGTGKLRMKPTTQTKRRRKKRRRKRRSTSTNSTGGSNLDLLLAAVTTTESEESSEDDADEAVPVSSPHKKRCRYEEDAGEMASKALRLELFSQQQQQPQAVCC